MGRKFIFCAFIFCAFITQARAEEFLSDDLMVDEPNATYEGINPVTVKELLLLGPGIEDRKTGNWMQLACVGDRTDALPPSSYLKKPLDPACKVLRFVFFKVGTDEAYYFGKPIVIVPKDGVTPTYRDAKKGMKEFYEGFHRKAGGFHLWSTIRSAVDSEAYRGALIMSIFMGPVIPGAVIFGIWVGYFGTAALDGLFQTTKPFTHARIYSHSVVSRNGECGPKKTVRHKIFNRMLQYQSAAVLQPQ